MYTPPSTGAAAGIEAVLFDLDGTLVLTHIDFAAMRAALTAVAVEAGVAPEDVAGLDLLAIVNRAMAHARELAGEEAARAITARAEEAMTAVELQGLEGATPAPHVREVLQAITARGVRVGIVTRNCRAVAAKELALASLDCPVVLTRNDVARCKPHPDHLLAALKQLQVAPEAAVMVGDHAMDIAAGRAAGMRTVGVLAEVSPADYFTAAGPDRVIRDLRELLPYLFGTP